MDPHEPFLKAILASRHDDLPRLVYADWLEESGEPWNVARAHFIRTQIHLEQADPKSDAYADLKALETRILETYLDEWRWVDLPESVRYGSELEQVKWRRGFPDDLGPMWEHEFRRSGAAAIAHWPLTAVQLTGSGPAFRFEDYPELAHIARVKLGPSFTALYATADGADEMSLTFDSLMTAPVFTSLRHLDLSENHLTDPWLVRFIALLPTASFAPTLESLDLSRNFGITDAGANVLATADALDRLKLLRIRDTRITPAGRTLLKKRFGSRLA